MVELSLELFVELAVLKGGKKNQAAASYGTGDYLNIRW